MSTRSRQYQGDGSSTKKLVTPKLIESPSSASNAFERACVDSPTPLQRLTHGSRSLPMENPQMPAKRSKKSVQAQSTRPTRSSRSQKLNLQNVRRASKSPKTTEPRTSGSKIRKTGQNGKSSMTSRRRTTRSASKTDLLPQGALAREATASQSPKDSTNISSTTKLEDKTTSEPTQPAQSLSQDPPGPVEEKRQEPQNLGESLSHTLPLHFTSSTHSIFQGLLLGVEDHLPN
ncbi:MAG: hypothetical protein LQ351_006382 [Letrouitia transgressa]|nr:MAG: hypothetical protein LQ351_006382 [Letrouitia transgressa]